MLCVVYFKVLKEEEACVQLVCRFYIMDSRVGRDNCMWSGSRNQISHLQSTICLVAAYTQIVN